jgi:hypothetical protein
MGSTELAARPAPTVWEGDELEITIQNSLPVWTVPNWRGLDGLTAAEPLITRSPLPPAGKETLATPLRQAGAFLCDLRLLGEDQARPMPVLPLIVAQSEPVAVHRDEVLLLEEWRLRPDGTPMAPGLDPKDARRFTPSTGSSRSTLQHPPVNGCGFASLAAVNAL